jgi:hypothetical protein
MACLGIDRKDFPLPPSCHVQNKAKAIMALSSLEETLSLFGVGLIM